MLTAFQKFINEHHLFLPSQKILLAVSGGIDSVVLSSLFKESKFDFGIAHCNFSLRGSESNQDEEFVKNLSSHYEVPFFSIRFDTIVEAENRKISIQMAARELRYEWFNRLLIRENYNFLATAHQANDVLETVLLNLTRGTGLAGLHGILNKNESVIRPLLFATREEIEKYAAENSLNWREDSSNKSEKYARNLIRHKVVSVLKELNPNIEYTTLQTTAKFKQVEDAFLFSLENERIKFETETDSSIQINVEKILHLPKAYLFHVLDKYGFSFLQSEAIFSIINTSGQVGKQFISENYTLVIDRTALVITQKSIEKASSNIKIAFIEASDTKIVFDKQVFQIEKLSYLNYEVSRDNAIGEFDFDLLHFPLELRFWKEGDHFIPLGMNGKKKLSDFLIDNKVPLNLKSSVKVLISNNEIAWILGMRISNTFKIHKHTKHVLRIQ